MFKGVAPIIAIILLIGVTISVVISAYLGFISLTNDIEHNIEKPIIDKFDARGADLKIDAFGNCNIYLRNTGIKDIPTEAINIYIDNKPTNQTYSINILKVNKVMKIGFSNLSYERHELKIKLMGNLVSQGYLSCMEESKACVYFDSENLDSNKSNTSIVVDITNLNNGSYTTCKNINISGIASAVRRNGKNGNLNLIFIMDSSGSMGWNDPSGFRKKGAKNLIDLLPKSNQVAIAVVDFDSYASVIQSFTFNHTKAKNAIDTLNAQGGTNIGKAVDLSNQYLIDNGNNKSAWIEILFTDGKGYYNQKSTLDAAKAGIIIHTMGLSNEVDKSLLEGIAKGTNGTYTYVDNPADLTVAFTKLTLTNIIGVTVNGNAATLNPDGSFEYNNFNLIEGNNTITAIVTATDNTTGYDEIVLTKFT